MLVRELIGAQVDSCTSDTKAEQAARRMLDDDVGSLAVIDGGELVGIVTERDLIAVVAGGCRDTVVGEVMTPRPDFLSPDIEVDDAADWMMAAGYRHLPVVDAGRIVGMLSIKDVLWALTQRRVRWSDEP